MMDDISPLTALRLFVPKVPSVLKSALYHQFWLSPTSTKWDLRTELTIHIVRSFMSGKPTPISKQQRLFKDPGIKGAVWISKVTLPPPPEPLLDLLATAINSSKTASGRYDVPRPVPVEAEWTGHRANARSDQPRPDLSEAQHYQKLLSEVTSALTVLYFHGGAYYLGDPSSHRGYLSRLARMTGGQCLSVRYRLAPQHPFPAALLDALTAYLSLLYPPPDSLHALTPASNVVLAGDSAGGGLCFALLQLLLQINRAAPTSPSLRFHNIDVTLPLPLPAGLAVISPWIDVTQSLPSILNNAQYDYLPPPLSSSARARFPADDVWPTKPPRGDLYCDTSILCHPLVSPVAAKDWDGACPVWIGVGEEMLVDESKVVAARMAKQGVPVQWDMWEAMPHCFALMLDRVGVSAANKCFEQWAGFCVQAIADGEEVVTRGTWYEAKTNKKIEMRVEDLAPLRDDEVEEKMRAAKEARMTGLEGEAKMMPRL